MHATLRAGGRARRVRPRQRPQQRLHVRPGGVHGARGGLLQHELAGHGRAHVGQDAGHRAGGLGLGLGLGLDLPICQSASTEQPVGSQSAGAAASRCASHGAARGRGARAAQGCGMHLCTRPASGVPRSSCRPRRCMQSLAAPAAAGKPQQHAGCQALSLLAGRCSRLPHTPLPHR